MAKITSGMRAEDQLQRRLRILRFPNRLRKPSIALGLMVVVASGLLLISLCAREPRYQGRTLTSWLDQCWETPLSETQRLAEAQTAIRAIGAQKALPTLLKLAETEDSRIRAWLVDKSEKRKIRFFHVRSAVQLQLQGIAGFEVLGTNAAPAVRKLTKLLRDKERAFVAARCLENIGKPAESALCECLTNADWRVRHFSVSALAAVTDDVEVYLARLQNRLKDAEPSVRFATVQCIGLQNDAPELAVPLLISVLEDTNDQVSSQAANALSGFGTNAASAFSALTNLVCAGRPGQSTAALKALGAIAPTEALPILSNTVATGSSTTFRLAVRSLKSIAPELALEMTLAAFHSPDRSRRSQAVNAALEYEMTAPGLADALKSAAKDADPETARRAVMTMKQMVQRQKERSRADVELPNEPSYEGKALHEWLKMRREGGELSTNAVIALRRMGTNVIPALLTRLTYKEPVFGLGDFDVSMEAVNGLIALRDEAKPALPSLTQLMDTDDRDTALLAMVATCGMGTNAIPFLIKGLTNRFADVRNEGANFLTQGALGVPSPEQRKQAFPLFMDRLSDPDEDVRKSATNQLKEFDPKDAAAAGIK